MRRLHLDQMEIAFIESAADALAELPKVTIACPHCGCPVVYPLVVRDGDAEMMQALLRIADKYLKESGASDAMMADVLATCALARARK